MNRHTPARLTLEPSKLNEVYAAVRDGGALTLTEIAARVGHPDRQIAPLVGSLVLMGALVSLVLDGATAYATPRTAAPLSA